MAVKNATSGVTELKSSPIFGLYSSLLPNLLVSVFSSGKWEHGGPQTSQGSREDSKRQGV